MIKVILFDLGEVVLTNDWHYDCPQKFDAYSTYFGINYNQMEEGWKSAWLDYELGKISEHVFWERFLSAAHAKKNDVKKAMELWRTYFDSKPEVLSIVEKLKKHYSLAVASSTGNEWLAYKRDTYNLDNYFTCYITTSNTGLKKVDEKFFKAVLERLAVNAQEILFIDDAQKVLDVASALGIQTILFQNSKQLVKDLKEYGVTL